MSFLEKVFNIHPHERKRVKYLFAFFFAVGFYTICVNTIIISAFNIRFGAIYLPYIYIIFPFVYLLSSIVYIKIMPVMDKRILFRYFIMVVFILHVLGFFILQGVFGYSLLYAFLLIAALFIEDNLIFLAVLIVQDVVDIESIKRLLPLASGSTTLGAISGALLLNNTAHLISSNLLFLIILPCIIAIACYADILLQKFKVIIEEPTGGKESSVAETLAYMRENWFYILLVAMVVVQLLATNINEFLFYNIATNILADESKLLAFLGTTAAYQYILVLLLNFFILTRLVLKLGSLNTVKLVLVSAVIATSLMMLSENLIFLALVSKVIFFVLVAELNESLTQMFFQSVNRRYKETFLIVTDLLITFAGYGLAGLIALGYSYGFFNIYIISGIALFFLAGMLMIWHLKQASFIVAMEKTIRTMGELDIKKIFGSMGLHRHLPALIQKIKYGSNEEKMVTLDLFERLDFKDKEVVLIASFARGNIVFKFRVLDMIFNKKADSCLIVKLMDYMDTQVFQYMIKNLFLNYLLMKNNGVINLIAQKKDYIDKEQLDFRTRLMFEYLYEGKQNNYEIILQDLYASQRNKDFSLILKIMQNFIWLEDEVNRRLLPPLMETLKDYRSMLKDAVQLCAYYENSASRENTYLGDVFAAYCNYELIEKVSAYYGPGRIRKILGSDERIIPRTYLLYNVTKAEQGKIDDYHSEYLEVREKLKNLIIEKQKILQADHLAVSLLLEETNRIIATVTAVLLDYLFIHYNIPLIQNLERHLQDKEKKDMVAEIVKNGLPLKVSGEIIPFIYESFSIGERAREDYNYTVLDTGGTAAKLIQLYRFMGGEILEEKISRDINQLLILKAVPIFSELDFEMLYHLLRIARHKNITRGINVVKKGETADSLFVLLEGEAVVYLQTKEEVLAILKQGDIFGELAVIDGGERTASVMTLKDCAFLEFKDVDFIPLLMKNGIITLSVIKTLSKRLRAMLESKLQPESTLDDTRNIPPVKGVTGARRPASRFL